MPWIHSVHGAYAPYVLGIIPVESCQLTGFFMGGLPGWEKPVSMGPSKVTVQDYLVDCVVTVFRWAYLTEHLIRWRLRFRRSGFGLSVCISDKLPGAAGVGPTL